MISREKLFKYQHRHQETFLEEIVAKTVSWPSVEKRAKCWLLIVLARQNEPVIEYPALGDLDSIWQTLVND